MKEKRKKESGSGQGRRNLTDYRNRIFEPEEELEPEYDEIDSDDPEYDMDPDDDMYPEDTREYIANLWTNIRIYVGLALLAAIICYILWQLVFPDKPKDPQNPDSTAAGEVNPGTEGQDPAGDGEAGSGDSLAEQVPGTQEAPAGQAGGMDGENSGQEEPAPGSQDWQAGGQEGDAMVSDDGESPGQNGEAPGNDGEGAGQEEKPGGGTAAMTFAEQQDSVTPKDVVNLRTVPSTTDDATIVVQAQNGEILTRTGVNEDTGWSRIVYGERTLYAVSQYLTTELDYKTPVQPSDPNRVSTISGRIILFTDCDDWITPKEYVNLRTEPSTSEGEATVSCQLYNGEKAHRTGYSIDSGWSRVEYNGQILYVVTSLMNETKPD